MKTETMSRNSQLLAALREAVGVVQMVLFKEIRARIAKKKPDAEASSISGLAGAITNEVFGTQNPGDKFVRFRAENLGEIEQELLALKDELPELRAEITDALRIQTLCDHQEGNDSSQTLVRAKEFGFLIEDRDVPLPSSFMMLVRSLGERHDIIIAPAQIHPAQDETMVH
ncbi:MAG: hypothetical protein KJ630_12515 [Proteobacteria bacterium]|nr:hypothetical protein [Pseudomonadota bacterium]